MSSILKGGEDILSKTDDAYNSAFLGADLELDGSRRREISLYRNNEVVLTVEHGVTLGLLKLIYSSDSNFQGILQGVRSRLTSDQPPVASVILSDDRVLDRDEYELIIQFDQPMQENLLQRTIATALPIQSSTIPLPPPQNSSIFMTNMNNGEKKMGQFVCEYCHLPFVSKAKFLRHRRIHTEENPYVCVYCNEAFPHHADLRKHRDENHMTNKSFKCNCCPKTFATRAELKGHLWRHTGEKNHKCRICEKGFATKGNLKLHIDKHIGVHKHKCPFCPQRFTSHSSLEAHMSKHTGMKAYKCRYCPKSYSQSAQLTSHERLHTGEKPFVCQVCGKEFRLNSTRLAHEKRHSGARPHICDTCGRSFSMPDHLRRHLKTHENKLDRLVSCPFCKKKIFSGRNMRKHLARHKELSLTEAQAKAISSSLKPDRELNERECIDDDQRSISSSSSNKTKQVIRCVECNEEVKSMRKLVEHLSEEHYHRELTTLEKKEVRLRHGLQKLHHCQFCSSFFMDYRLLRSHVLNEHPEHAEDVGFAPRSYGRRNTTATHKCPNCSLFFQLRSALDDHIIRDHLSTFYDADEGNSPVIKFKCWYCPRDFGTPEEVVSHMTNEHESLDVLSKRVEMTEPTSENEISSSGIWACIHCPVTLKSELAYKSHISQHTPKISTTSHECSTIVRSELSDVDETQSYLNPIDLQVNKDDLEDCVMKKYLKSDTSISLPVDSIIQSSSSFAKDNIDELDSIQQNDGLESQDDLDSNLVVNTPKLYEDMGDRINLEIDKVASVGEGKDSAEISSEKNFVSVEDQKLLKNQENGLFENEQDLVIASPQNGTIMEFEHSCTDVQDTPKMLESVDAAEKNIHEGDRSNANVRISIETKEIEPDFPENIIKSKKKKKKKDKHRDKKRKTESCRICSASFREKTDLYDHIKEEHANEEGGSALFCCWFCSVTFSCPEDVVSHMTNEHENLDNLSRRIEETDVNNSIANEKENTKLKMFKRSADASLFQDDTFQCLKCPKKMGSKEAYELHVITHGSTEDSDLNTNEIFNRNRSIERSNSTPLPDDSLSVEPIEVAGTSNSFPPISGNDNFSISRPDVPVLLSSTSSTLSVMDEIKLAASSVKENIKKFTGVQKKRKDSSTFKEFSKKSKKSANKKANLSDLAKSQMVQKKPGATLIIDGGLNVAVNMCCHCSRAFCSKKALDVHTLKMHGKEFLQRHLPPLSTSPFSCWFCSAYFTSPELVVEHMTNAHENLDKLSKRVENQDLPFISLNVPQHNSSLTQNNSSSSQEKQTVTSQKQIENVSSNRFIPIAPQKQVVQLPSASLTPPQPSVATTTTATEPSHQPPPGFKMSYALAYVPIFIPERNENGEAKKD